MTATKTIIMREFGPTGFELFHVAGKVAHEIVPCSYATLASVAQVLHDYLPYHRKHATAFDTTTGRRVHPYEVAPQTLSVVVTQPLTEIIAVVHGKGIIPLSITRSGKSLSFEAIYAALEEHVKHPVDDNTLAILPFSRQEPIPISRHSPHLYNGQIIHYLITTGAAQPALPIIYPPSHTEAVTAQVATECATTRKKNGTIVVYITKGTSTAIPPHTVIGPICIISSTGTLACGTVVTNSPSPLAYISCLYTYSLHVVS